MKTKLSICVETGDLQLTMDVLKALPGLQGQAAFDDTRQVSTCQSFLRAMGSVAEQDWFKGFAREAINGRVETKFMEDQFIFRHEDYCLSIQPMMDDDDDEIAGWSLNIAATPDLLRTILSLVEKAKPVTVSHLPSMTTIIKLDGKATPVQQAWKVIGTEAS